MPFIPAIIGAIIADVTAVGTAVAGAATGIAEGIGIPAALAGPIGSGVEFGLGEGALGAGEAAITGHDPLKGFESGAISGFVGGAGGGLIGEIAPGVSPMVSSTLANAAGGALGSFATGGNPATGALEGGASGLVSSVLPGLAKGLSAPGASAAGVAAPPSVTPDLASSGQITAAPVTSTLPGSAGAGAAAGSAGSLPGDVSGAVSDITGATYSGVNAPSAASATGAGVPASASVPATGGTDYSGAISDITGATYSGVNQPLTPVPVQTAGGGANLNPGPLTGAANPLGLSTVGGGGRGTGFLNTLEKNPGLALAGVGLLGDVMKGNQMAPAEKALNASAQRLGLQGQLDETYLRSGTLPPAQQAILNAQGEAAKAAINSQYASRGTPGSSANVEDIAGENLRQAAVGGEMAMQLFQSGIEETQMSNEILLQLLNVQLGEDSDLANGVSKLSTSLANMGQPIQAGMNA